MSSFCKHYNGIPFLVCDFGVVYTAVEDRSQTPYRHPCYDPSLKHLCVNALYPTKEELEEEDREITEMLNTFMAKIQAGTCPHCDQPMTKRQVGRCVYAEPCGHRLYQGKV